MTIPPAQQAALVKLGSMLPGSYYLVGGVGVAAHLAHRSSRDLDLFSPSDPNELLSRLHVLPGAVLTNRAPGTIHLVLDGVPVSLIRYEYPLLATVDAIPGVPVSVASLVDLACMKLSAIANRGSARDFWDLHAIVKATGKSLSELTAAFQAKFAPIDPGHAIRSLTYFGDAESEPLPAGLTPEMWKTMKRDMQQWVLELDE